MEQPILSPVADPPAPIETQRTDGSAIAEAITGLTDTVGAVVDSGRLSKYETEIVEAEDSYTQAIKNTKARLEAQTAEINSSLLKPFARELAKQDLISQQTKRDKSEVLVEKEKIFRKYASRYPSLVPELLKTAKQSGLGKDGVSYETQAAIDEYNGMLTGTKGAAADAATRWEAIVKMGEGFKVLPEDPRFADAEGNVDPDAYAEHIIKLGRQQEFMNSSEAQLKTIEADDKLNLLYADKETDRKLIEGQDYIENTFESSLSEVSRILTDPQLLASQGPNYAQDAQRNVLQSITRAENNLYAQLAQGYTDRGIRVPDNLRARVQEYSKPYKDIAAMYSPAEWRAAIEANRGIRDDSAELTIVDPQTKAYIEFGASVVRAGGSPLQNTVYKDNTGAALKGANRAFSDKLAREEGLAAAGSHTRHYTPTMNPDGSPNLDADPYREEVDAQRFNPQKGAQTPEELAATRMVVERIPRWRANLASDDPQLQRRAMFQVLATIKGLAPVYERGTSIPDTKLSEGLFSILADDKGWEILKQTGVLTEEIETLKQDFPIVAQYEVNELAGLARNAILKARDTVVGQRGVRKDEEGLYGLGGRIPTEAELKRERVTTRGGENRVFLTINKDYEVSFTTSDLNNTTPEMDTLLNSLNAEYGGRMSNFTKVIGKLQGTDPSILLNALTSQKGFPVELREPREESGDQGKGETPSPK